MKIKAQNDRAILMICIGIAFIFWLIVKLSQVYTVWKHIQIDIEVPQGKALANLPPENLMANIEAKGWDLLFNREKISNLELNYSFGNRVALLIPQWQINTDVSKNLTAPRLKVLDINYSEIHLKLEDKLEKKIPIVLNKRIAFAEGFYFLDTIKIEPDSLLISGPISLVEPITFWETDSLVLLNLKKSKTQSIDIQKGKRVLSLSYDKVSVQIPVEKYTEKIFFIPVEMKNVPEEDSLSIFPKSVNIRCVVGLSKYDELSASDFSFEVDLDIANLSEGKNTTPILLTRKPDFVQGVNYTPKAATFYIIKRVEVDELSIQSQ